MSAQTNKYGGERVAHWVKENQQNRIPKRWVAFDTEAHTRKSDDGEVQSWRLGAAVRWRRDLKRTDALESDVFGTPEALWRWVVDFCKPETRTVVVAHNLAYDARISRALELLPNLGFELEWSNLDRNVSAMVWRSENGTLVFSDLFTWLPYPLRDIGKWLNLHKREMPEQSESDDRWANYCLRDADIVRAAVSEIVQYLDSENLGNWQPTGAGTAYSMWRHRFMPERVLVHDNEQVLSLERRGMHTGRAEAWRHGKLRKDTWHEVDMRSAYTFIAAECALPAKLKYTGNGLTIDQFKRLNQVYAILAEATVTTAHPVVPHDNGERTIWPTGKFQTVLWDTELQEILNSGGSFQIKRYATYVRKPVLEEWATFVLDRILNDGVMESEIARRYLKHVGRALIGRLSLRVPTWELWGANPDGYTGISHQVDSDTRKVHRMLHVGDKTFIQTDRREAKDSLPQITGWIMSECRMRLWRAMSAAGFENIAHVDTDCLLVNSEGLARLREYCGTTFDQYWQIKGKWTLVDVTGPRNYRTGNNRKVSGVPRKAREVSPGRFLGELWGSIGSDMETGYSGTVTIRPGEWNVKMEDPRRMDAPGIPGRTVAIQL